MNKKGFRHMKVKKTLHQIHMELKDLRDNRDIIARTLANAVVKDSRIVDSLKDEYNHFNELIEYYSQIEVEFEDKYEIEEDE